MLRIFVWFGIDHVETITHLSNNFPARLLNIEKNSKKKPENYSVNNHLH